MTVFTTAAPVIAFWGEPVPAHGSPSPSPEGTAFADALRQAQAEGAPPPARRSPQETSKRLFGDAYDPATNSVRVDKFAALVKRRADEFAERFRQRLAAAGIDASRPIELSVRHDGRVVVDGNHPQAARIRDLMDQDPELARAYRTVAAQSVQAARGLLAAAYARDWHAARTDEARAEVWHRYAGLMDRLDMMGSRMVIGPKGATASAMQVLEARGLA